jgi:hypothetical protein
MQTFVGVRVSAPEKSANDKPTQNNRSTSNSSGLGRHILSNVIDGIGEVDIHGER